MYDYCEKCCAKLKALTPLICSATLNLGEPVGVKVERRRTFVEIDRSREREPKTTCRRTLTDTKKKGEFETMASYRYMVASHKTTTKSSFRDQLGTPASAKASHSKSKGLQDSKSE